MSFSIKGQEGYLNDLINFVHYIYIEHCEQLSVLSLTVQVSIAVS